MLRPLLISDFPPATETARLAALHRYEILDTPEEAEFDDFTRLAAHLCEVPIAIISLVDSDRQWFKSEIGLGIRETPLDASICKHAILQKGLFVVPDTILDQRFRDNPLVTGDPLLRFYAGALLESSEGLPLGTLCVLDYQPRQLTTAQGEALTLLARQIMTTLELRLSRGRLNNTIESISDAFFTLDHEFRFTYLNSQAERLLGRSREEFLGQVIWEVCDEEDQAHFALQCRGAATAREMVAFEAFHKQTALWLDVRMYPSPDGLTVYFQDVTARKQAEQRLQRLNQLYALSNGINEAILRLHDTQQIYEQACRIAVEQGGLLMAWVGLVEPGSGELKPVARWGEDTGYLDDLRISVRDEPGGWGPSGIAFRTGACSCCNQIASDPAFAPWRDLALERGYQSAASFPLKLTGQPIGVFVVYGAQPGYFEQEELRLLNALANNLSFAIDTQHGEQQRLHAESALRASEAMMAAAQSIAHIGSWELDLTKEDPDANALRWSDEMFRIAGFQPGTVAVTNELFFQLAHPDDHAPIRLAVAAAIQEQKPYAIVHRLIRPGGEERIVHEAAQVFLDEQTGRPSKMVGTAHDITEHRNLEEQARRAQRIESIGTLAGGIAHDLNNVLAPIMMSIEVLKQDERDPTRLRILNTIEASAGRGADMVRQVLYFARGAEGEKGTVPVGSQLLEIKQIVHDTFPKNISVCSGIPADLWDVPGDATQLHQILLNLCVNARDAMSEGGTLTLSAHNLLVDAHYAGLNIEATPGPHVVIQVEDTGCGIPPAVIERIFEPFFTTKELGKGTGLGLSTTLGIIKNHGGFIRVSSQPRLGTTFRVYLPAQANAATGAKSSAIAEPPRGNGELVLVIDDEDAVLQITRHTLEAFGYRVLLACDGADATALFAVQRQDIAVVITDMMMPWMDGPTTIQVLKRMKPSIGIIAASGLGSDAMKARAVEAGARYFLPKPYTAETMLKALHAVLAGPVDSTKHGG